MNELLIEHTYAGELCWQHIGLLIRTPALVELGHTDGLPILTFNMSSYIEDGKYKGNIDVHTICDSIISLDPNQAVELIYN